MEKDFIFHFHIYFSTSFAFYFLVSDNNLAPARMVSFNTKILNSGVSTCLKLSNTLNSFNNGVKDHIFQKTEKQRETYFCFLKRCVSHQHLQLTLENSNTQFLELFDSSNKFFGPFKITHLFRQKTSQYLESRYLEYLGRSNQVVGPLDDFHTFSQTFVLTFRLKSESSKDQTFYSIFR